MEGQQFLRREFLERAAIASAALGTATVLRQPSAIANSARLNANAVAKHPIGVFTKPFVSLTFSQLAAEMVKLGVDGIEAPIRQGGHLSISQIETELPRLVQTLKDQGLKILIMASDINDPSDKDSVRVLETAAANGIRRYRLKYFRYAPHRSIKLQLANWKAQLKDLAALNKQLGIQGLYQNHAGKQYFGAAVWDLADALEDINPDDLGVAYDIRHATVEGGLSWPTTLRRILPHLQTLYIKDFRWDQNKLVNVPLGTGYVDSKFLEILRQAKFSGPISLHEEYLDHRKPELIPQHLEAMQRDLGVLQKWLTQ